MFGKLFKYIWNPAENIKENNEDIPRQSARESNERQFKGTVTDVFGEHGMVNHEVYFDKRAVEGVIPEVGACVWVNARRNHCNAGWVAQLLAVISESTNTAQPLTDCKISQDSSKNITGETPLTKVKGRDETGICVASETSERVPATVEHNVGEVTRIRQTFGQINNLMDFNFTECATGYIPDRGDLVSFSIRSEENSKIVFDVKPVRVLEFEGEVKLCGFRKPLQVDNVWIPRHNRHTGDSVAGQVVCGKAVENTLHRDIPWRAFLFERSGSSQSRYVVPVSPMQGKLLNELCSDKDGLHVNPKFILGQMIVGNSAQSSDIQIKNSSGMPQKLQRVCLLSADNTIISLKPAESCVDLQCSIDVQPRNTSSIRVFCTPKNVGVEKQLLSLDFGSFKLYTQLLLEVTDPRLRALNPANPYVPRKGYSGQLEETSHNWIVPGRKVQTAMKSVRLPNRLGQFPVPESVKRAYMNRDSLEEYIPAVRQELKMASFIEKFRGLLYLEEIQQEIALREFDMQRVSLYGAGEFLRLEVPGLSERLPSVLVGDSILLREPLLPEHAPCWQGYVHDSTQHSLLLKFTEQFHENYSGEDYNVTFVLNRVPFRRCHQALEFSVNIGDQVLFPSELLPQLAQVRLPKLSKDPSQDLSLTATHATSPAATLIVSPAVTHATSSTATHAISPAATHATSPAATHATNPAATPIASHAATQMVAPAATHATKPEATPIASPAGVHRCRGPPRHSLRSTPTLPFINPRLNARQRAAVLRIVQGQGRPTPYVIFGPPGTGKTVTVVEVVLQLLSLLPSSRLLLCTPSNSAADLLIERLHASDRLLPGTMCRLNAASRLEENVPECVRAYALAGEELCAAARRRLVVATCNTAARLYELGLQPGHFTHAIVDEAGQTTEPECMIPLGLVVGKNGQIVLAGDPMQLGPVLKSRQAARLGLGQSLLERLTMLPLYQRDERKFAGHGNYDPLLVTKLVENYRSHAVLLAPVSRIFYNNELQESAPPSVTAVLQHWDALPAPGKPFIFHGVQGLNLREGNNPSWFNPAEALQVLLYTKRLLANQKPPLTADDIGIITPYRKQVEKVRLLLSSTGVEGVKVGSVEEFQGQERPVVILSTVRSSADFLQDDARLNLGFLSNPKRFNVAVSRAQALLIVIGNPEVLAQDCMWRELLQYAVDIGAYTGCALPVEFYREQLQSEALSLSKEDTRTEDKSQSTAIDQNNAVEFNPSRYANIPETPPVSPTCDDMKCTVSVAAVNSVATENCRGVSYLNEETFATCASTSVDIPKGDLADIILNRNIKPELKNVPSPVGPKMCPSRTKVSREKCKTSSKSKRNIPSPKGEKDSSLSQNKSVDRVCNERTPTLFTRQADLVGTTLDTNKHKGPSVLGSRDIQSWDTTGGAEFRSYGSSRWIPYLNETGFITSNTLPVKEYSSSDLDVIILKKDLTPELLHVSTSESAKMCRSENKRFSVSSKLKYDATRPQNGKHKRSHRHTVIDSLMSSFAHLPYTEPVPTPNQAFNETSNPQRDTTNFESDLTYCHAPSETSPDLHRVTPNTESVPTFHQALSETSPDLHNETPNTESVATYFPARNETSRGPQRNIPNTGSDPTYRQAFSETSPDLHHETPNTELAPTFCLTINKTLRGPQRNIPNTGSDPTYRQALSGTSSNPGRDTPATVSQPDQLSSVCRVDSVSAHSNAFVGLKDSTVTFAHAHDVGSVGEPDKECVLLSQAVSDSSETGHDVRPKYGVLPANGLSESVTDSFDHIKQKVPKSVLSDTSAGTLSSTTLSSADSSVESSVTTLNLVEDSSLISKFKKIKINHLNTAVPLADVKTANACAKSKTNHCDDIDIAVNCDTLRSRQSGSTKNHGLSEDAKSETLTSLTSNRGDLCSEPSVVCGDSTNITFNPDTLRSRQSGSTKNHGLSEDAKSETLASLTSNRGDLCSEPSVVCGDNTNITFNPDTLRSRQSGSTKNRGLPVAAKSETLASTVSSRGGMRGSAPSVGCGDNTNIAFDPDTFRSRQSGSTKNHGCLPEDRKKKTLANLASSRGGLWVSEPSVVCGDINEQIVQQIEYYFGDVNLCKDKFMQNEIAKDSNGWFPLKVLTMFKKLQAISTDFEVICKALESAKDPLMEVHPDRSHVRRSPLYPLPGSWPAWKHSIYLRSVVLEGVPTDVSREGVYDSVTKTYGPVEHIESGIPALAQNGSVSLLLVVFRTQEVLPRVGRLVHVSNSPQPLRAHVLNTCVRQCVDALYARRVLGQRRLRPVRLHKAAGRGDRQTEPERGARTNRPHGHDVLRTASSPKRNGEANRRGERRDRCRDGPLGMNERAVMNSEADHKSEGGYGVKEFWGVSPARPGATDGCSRHTNDVRASARHRTDSEKGGSSPASDVSDRQARMLRCLDDDVVTFQPVSPNPNKTTATHIPRTQQLLSRIMYGLNTSGATKLANSEHTQSSTDTSTSHSFTHDLSSNNNNDALASYGKCSTVPTRRLSTPGATFDSPVSEEPSSSPNPRFGAIDRSPKSLTTSPNPWGRGRGILTLAGSCSKPGTVAKNCTVSNDHSVVCNEKSFSSGAKMKSYNSRDMGNASNVPFTKERANDCHVMQIPNETTKFNSQLSPHPISSKTTKLSSQYSPHRTAHESQESGARLADGFVDGSERCGPEQRDGDVIVEAEEEISPSDEDAAFM